MASPLLNVFLGDEPGSLGSARLYTEMLGEEEHFTRKEVRRRVEPRANGRYQLGIIS